MNIFTPALLSIDWASHNSAMSMEEAATIADEVFRMSLNYVIEEINDLSSLSPGLPAQQNADQNSNSKPRKRVFVKTYVEEIDSTIDVVDSSLSSVSYLAENGSALKTSDIFQPAPDSANELLAEFSSIAPNNIYFTTKTYNGNNSCELSLFETQQVLDDLLN